MNYEFVSRIPIKRNRKYSVKRALLTLGLILFFIALVIEIFLKNYAFLAIIVPMLYLMSLRLKMRGNVSYKEVCVHINSNINHIEITVFNCTYVNGELINKKYVIREDTPAILTFMSAQSKLSLQFEGEEMTVSHDNAVLGKTQFNSELVFYSNSNTAMDVSNALKLSLKCI